MSMEAIRQLNSGGLKLKTNFSAKSVAANISANRSAIASKYSIFGSNRMFTPANRMGGTPKYASSSMISRGINRQSMSYVGGDIPVSSASYSQNVTMGTSSAFNAGNAIGMILGAAPTVLGALNKMGLFGGNDLSGQSKGKVLSEQMQHAFGSYTPVDTGTMSSAGLPTASSFGANFDSSYSSVEAYMKSDTMDPEALKSSANSLVSSALNDINSAEANFNILKGREAAVMTNRQNLQNNMDAALADKNNAKTELGESQSKLKSAKQNRTNMDAVLSEKNAGYKEACADLTNKEGIRDKKQAEVSTCKQGVATAESAHTQAVENLGAARNALNNLPVTATPQQKAAAEAALRKAEQAENKAKQELDAANNKLKDAEQELDKAKKDVEKAQSEKAKALEAAEQADSNLKDAVKNCKDAETQVQNAQKQLDNSTKEYDKCNKTYIEAENKMHDASGVISQCQEYNSKMQTLKNNLVKATKLQEKANKAAGKAESKAKDKKENTVKPEENKKNNDK